ncbi:MAG: type II toxin-antitoxin system RelB/DinJ family antitoxin [Gammaproteobacteria bacterium]|nr:type II toxin-antitoxin system RelB/DinJ family antitoxin [Gammaproteobacteria bacterium]HQT05426.1 type II toxin-antitoxin system RelB/DinJ family antitoxin [Thiotrichales bacterium]
MSSTMVHVRIDETIKQQASETLQAMGLSLSDAVRVFLTRVVADKKIPFDLRAPNSDTLAAMKEADEIAGSRMARFSTVDDLINDIEKNSH